MDLLEIPMVGRSFNWIEQAGLQKAYLIDL